MRKFATQNIILTTKRIHPGNSISDQQWSQYAAAHNSQRASVIIQQKPRPVTVLRRKSLPTVAVYTVSYQNGICNPSHAHSISNNFCPPNLWWTYVVHISKDTCNFCFTGCMHFLLVVFPILKYQPIRVLLTHGPISDAASRVIYGLKNVSHVQKGWGNMYVKWDEKRIA